VNGRRFWEEKALKYIDVNADKTETVVCVRTAEQLQITDKKNGKALKQVENFKYLFLVIHFQGGKDFDITARIAASWKMERVIRSVV